MLVLIGLTFCMLMGAQSVEANKNRFKCLMDMAIVRGYFVDNLLHNLAATLNVVESELAAKLALGLRVRAQWQK